MRKKCPHSEFFWSLFSRMRTEYGDLLGKSPYSARMRENMDEKNIFQKKMKILAQEVKYTIISNTHTFRLDK